MKPHLDKSKSNSISASHGEQGYILITVLVLGAVIIAIFSAFTSQLHSNQKVQSFIRAKFDQTSYVNSIVMIFSNEEICSSPENIAAGFIGRNIGEMMALSAPTIKNIQLRTPSTGAGAVTGPDSGLILSKTKKFQGLIVEGVWFSQPVVVNPVSYSYKTELTIELNDPQNPFLKAVKIPFYLVADATGAFKTCSATVYPDPDATSPYTLEDMVCKELEPTTPRYDPGHKVCII